MSYQRKSRFLTSSAVIECIRHSLQMLSPLVQLKNPVMFVTYLGAFMTTVITLIEIFHGTISWFNIQISLWLWFTVLFANFAESLAESRGKAQTASLRKAKVESVAHKLENNIEADIPSPQLKLGDIIVCRAGDIIAADGEVIEGVATVDESAITGESAPVIRESGGDRSAVTAGTRVVSDILKIRVTSEPGKSFLDNMIRLIEGAKRQKTPNEVALHIVLCALTIILLLGVVSLKFFSDYSVNASIEGTKDILSVPILIALLVCLIPTTIGALLSAIGIAGMDRLIRCNVIAKSGRAVEAAGDVDILILDKTGTITMGNRMAAAFIPISGSGCTEKEFADLAQLASLSDETPEGRSVVVLAKEKYGLRAKSFDPIKNVCIPFSAATRMSGVDFLDDQGKVIRQIRKGAFVAINEHVKSLGGAASPKADSLVKEIANQGATPLLVSDNQRIMGVILLKDMIKGGIKERFARMRSMGIRTIMITGDNALTAAAIAAEAGVDDFVPEATPEMKLALIKKEQAGGRLVAMTGDGTNDAPALAQSDVGVAMNTGTQASREAGNMVDLDSNPTKLIDIVEIGKQLLMTRGALTTFSIANDLAKYFAIIPAIFSGIYAAKLGEEGPLTVLNVMGLHSYESAVLSAVIFNALIIVVLIPLALRGVSYKAQSASALLRNNILIYGLGGVIVPFIGIKAIDLVLFYLNIV